MKHENILSEVFQIAGDAPELNMNNYTVEDVDKLNDAMIDIYNAVKVAFDPREPKEADIFQDIVCCPLCHNTKLTQRIDDTLSCNKCGIVFVG